MGAEVPFDMKKKYLKFLKTCPEFSVGQSSFDMKFFRLLGHFEVKSTDPSDISRAELAAVGKVPLPVCCHEGAGAGEALPGPGNARGLLSWALLPSFDKKHNLEFLCRKRGRELQGRQRVGS